MRTCASSVWKSWLATWQTRLVPMVPVRSTCGASQCEEDVS